MLEIGFRNAASLSHAHGTAGGGRLGAGHGRKRRGEAVTLRRRRGPRSCGTAAGRSSRLILLAVLVALLAGCSVFPRRITYRRAGVVGSGSQEAYSTRIRYDSLEIGDPRRPLVASPVVTLKLPGGTTVRTDRLDVSGLRRLSTRIHRDPPLRGDRGWPEGMEEICIGDYSFFVVEEKVVSVLVGSGRPSEPSAPPPEIGDAQGTVFYRFPLTHKQLVRLFGKPETLSKDLAYLP